jgi:hypothetical protein
VRLASKRAMTRSVTFVLLRIALFINKNMLYEVIYCNTVAMRHYSSNFRLGGTCNRRCYVNPGSFFCSMLPVQLAPWCGGLFQEAAYRSTCQEIPSHLWNLMAHFSHMLSQLNPIHALIPSPHRHIISDLHSSVLKPSRQSRCLISSMSQFQLTWTPTKSKLDQYFADFLAVDSSQLLTFRVPYDMSISRCLCHVK